MPKRWSLEDVPWDRFDPSRVDPEMLKVVKAASLVERNSHDYAAYLCNIFDDDAEFQRLVRAWSDEEVQHGDALGRWAELADPGFDFREAFGRFREAFRISVDAEQSVRGSRTGEMIARCVVETATSSMYSALRDAAGEPVLAFICARIAEDEFRHYRLFYQNLQRCLDEDRPSVLRRAAVAVGRVNEADDDELALAYHCANTPTQPYDRRAAGRAYGGRAFSYYRQTHVDRAVTMTLRAVGLRPKGRLSAVASRLAWWQLRRYGAAAA